MSLPTDPKDALVDIEKALAADIDRSDWMSAMNESSLQSLQMLYTEAALSSGARARFQFVHGDVVGNAAPAHLLLRFVSELNEAVIAAGNALLLKPRKVIDDRLREKLGLWLFAPQPGSVVFEVAVPPTPDDSRMQGGIEDSLPGTDRVESVAEISLKRVVRSLKIATTSDANSDEIVASLLRLGRPAVRHIDRLASRSEAGDFSVNIESPRNMIVDEPFTFRPRDAAVVRSVIKHHDLDRVEVEYVGIITTASRRRSIFDLECDDGRIVTGTVPAAIRSQVADLFDTRVRVIVDERTDPGDPDGSSVRRTIRSVEAAPLGT